MSKFSKIIVFGVLILVGLVAVFVLLKNRGDYVFDQSRIAVIKEMQSLNRLETAQFTIEKIIDAQTSGSALKQFLFGDKILLIAHGQVIAGFDLSKVSESDIRVQNQSLTVEMPPPEILVTSIDNQKTKVYDRTQGLLSKGDPDLESAARAEAETTIRKAACDSGILDQASENARKQLTPIFQSFGFQSVTLEIPQGSC